MITAITIENFKGIRDRVRLEVRPLTLVFGPNNGGKSSVLQAIHYAREVLLRHNLDAHKTASGGESVDLGGFANFVHQRDLNREIRLRFDMKLGEGATLPHLIDLSDARDFDESKGARSLTVSTGAANCVRRIDRQARSCWVELAIAWHNATRSPHVVQCITGFDEEQIASIHYDPDLGNLRIVDLNFEHPLFTVRLPPENFPEIVEEVRATIEREQPLDPDGRYEQELEYRLRTSFRAIESRGEGQQEEIDRSREFEEEFGNSTLTYWYREILADGAKVDLEDGVIPLGVQADALPRPNAPLTLGLERYEENRAVWKIKPMVEKQGPLDLNVILSHIIAAPVQLLRELLNPLRYLGPLRSIPGREYSPTKFSDVGQQVNGLAAWNSLAFGSDEMIAEVDYWMSGKDRFRSGISVQRKMFKLMPADTRLAELPDVFDRTPANLKIILVDANNGLQVQPQEIGVGVSQLLPVVVGALESAKGILLVEQPELHLHPRMQCEAGDLFITGALGGSPKTILIETHSEHLILRILRRIRESTRGHLHGGIRVTADDVAVWYVSQEDGQSAPQMIGIDEHGEFTRDWPDDFFESDFYERFG